MDACTVPLISILTQRRRILSCCRVFLFKLLLTLSASNNKIIIIVISPILFISFHPSEENHCVIS